MEEIEIESCVSEESPTACVSGYVAYRGREICYEIHDFLCLNDHRRLNDDAIEFFLGKLAQESDVLCFSPRFYTRLTSSATHGAIDDGHAGFVNAARSRIAYENVRKWYTGVFGHDMLILRGHHWILLVVCYPSAIPTVTASTGTRADVVVPGPVCYIMAFDSSSGLKWVTEELVTPIRDYLTLQWVEECRGELHDVDFGVIEMVKMATPQQKNDYDCGLYVLRMAEEVVKCPPEIDDFRFVGKRGFRMKYVNAFRGKGMQEYRKSLKAMVKQCSVMQGLWQESWNVLLC